MAGEGEWQEEGAGEGSVAFKGRGVESEEDDHKLNTLTHIHNSLYGHHQLIQLTNLKWKFTAIEYTGVRVRLITSCYLHG